ncbi:MAG: hypothetical protein EHM77_06640, partial [Planctomycetaceae bacterium]
GETLPRSKRIYHISPVEARHMEDIIDLLCKHGYVAPSPIDTNGTHLYGLSSYLVPRAKPGCMGRLIVDFSTINDVIESPPNVVPETGATLQFLQGKSFFSSIDLRYAYLGLRLSPESRHLTTFLTPNGSYQWVSLPTGAACSPPYFLDAINKILNFTPKLDENGEPIFEAPNRVALVKSTLDFAKSYFDDILTATPLLNTYDESLNFHFEQLERVVSRLAFHGSKISVPKSDFFKSRIVFLGWVITRDYVIADPRRIKKVEEYSFPPNKKGMRAFLGLVNSLRRVTSLPVIEQITILSPLTSSKGDYSPTEQHKTAFLQVKKLLTEEPLFSNLIDETAPKYLFVDAASKTGVLGGVLCQKIVANPDEKIIPLNIDLEDEVHRIIYDKKLGFEPCKLHTKLPITSSELGIPTSTPPNIEPVDPLLGYTESTIPDSFFWSIISILAHYKNKLPASTLELRAQCVKKLKQPTNAIWFNKLKDHTFDLNFGKCNEFLKSFIAGKVGLDPNYYLAEMMAVILGRSITFISSVDRHANKPVWTINPSNDRPPLILGIYLRDNIEIFKPFFLNKHSEFNLDSLKDRIQIIAYCSKSIPETLRSRPILDLEVFAILSALYSLNRFISGVEVTLLSDSQVLYYLFNSAVGNSSVKIRRWC